MSRYLIKPAHASQGHLKIYPIIFLSAIFFFFFFLSAVIELDNLDEKEKV